MNTAAKTKRFKVQRYVREVTDDYGRAGEIEWHVMDHKNPLWPDCAEVFSLRRLAKAFAEKLEAEHVTSQDAS